MNAFADIDTPAVLVDLDVAEANIDRFQKYCNLHGFQNRPHIKTHKLPSLARRQIEAGAAGITCQKISEAEAMIAEGVPLRRWQTRTIPEQTLFYYRDAYGKGCPWSCGHARQSVEYRPEDYPNARQFVEDFLCIGHSTGGLGPPNDLSLMELYVGAFHKVLLDNRDEFVTLVRSG